MALYADRLELCDTVIPLDSITGLSLFGPQTVDLTAGGRHFEISSPKRRCTRKYTLVIDHLRSLQSAEEQPR